MRKEIVFKFLNDYITLKKNMKYVMLLNKLFNDSKDFFLMFRHFWASFMFILVYFVLLSLSLMCEVLTRIIIILSVILNFLHLRKGHLLHINIANEQRMRVLSHVPLFAAQ